MSKRAIAFDAVTAPPSNMIQVSHFVPKCRGIAWTQGTFVYAAEHAVNSGAFSAGFNNDLAMTRSLPTQVDSESPAISFSYV